MSFMKDQLIDIAATMEHHYNVAALWATVGDDGEPLDANYDLDDIHTPNATLSEIMEFVLDNMEDLQAAIDQHGATWEQHGHDLLLTREGHGAGYWDRGYGDLGERLTTAAHIYGAADFYVGDDGKIYSS